MLSFLSGKVSIRFKPNNRIPTQKMEKKTFKNGQKIFKNVFIYSTLSNINIAKMTKWLISLLFDCQVWTTWRSRSSPLPGTTRDWRSFSLWVRTLRGTETLPRHLSGERRGGDQTRLRKRYQERRRQFGNLLFMGQSFFVISAFMIWNISKDFNIFVYCNHVCFYSLRKLKRHNRTPPL